MPEPQNLTLQDENGNDIDVEFVVKRVPISAEGELENLLGKYAISADMTEFGGNIPSGSIRNLILRHGVKWMNVGGRERKINQNNPYASLPDLRDDETGESIAEKLCQAIVQLPTNAWLVDNDSYAQVFRRYRAPEGESGNPTATSTNGRGSSSAQAEKQQDQPKKPLSPVTT